MTGPVFLIVLTFSLTALGFASGELEGAFLVAPMLLLILVMLEALS